MKNFWLGLAFLLTPLSIEAQTITLGPIANAVSCSWDSTTIAYHANGNFLPGNVFILQTSADHFQSFTNIAYDSSVASSFRVLFPWSNRVRVMASQPYAVSADTQFQLLSHPKISAVISRYKATTWWSNGWTELPYALPPEDGPYHTWEFPVGFVGDSLTFHEGDSDAYYSEHEWLFDQDAQVTVLPSPFPIVVYPSAGIKTGRLTEKDTTTGCSSTIDFAYRIISCTPVIPGNARVVTSNDTGIDSVVWIKAGGTYYFTRDYPPTITAYVEPGGALVVDRYAVGICYLKPGGSCSNRGNGAMFVVTLGDTIGAPLNPLVCPDLTFDYSQINAAVSTQPEPTITITQNSDQLRIRTEEQSISTRLFSLLGTEILSQRGTGTLDIDLSLLPAGMYFAVIEAGGEREVRKIVVAH